MKKQIQFTERQDAFERTTRQLRWVSIVAVMITFPPGVPQAKYVYVFGALAALYNAFRYVEPVMRNRIFHSPLLNIIVDSLFVGMLIVLAGNPSTPYSGFLMFMIVTASYLYRFKGAVAIALFQAAIIVYMMSQRMFLPVPFDEVRVITIILYVLLALGFLVTRLTHQDKVERDMLRDLQMKSEQDRSRLLALIDSLHSALYVTDISGRIIQHNEAGRILAGADHELVGNKFITALPLFKRTDPRHKRVNILKDTSAAQQRRDLSMASADGKIIDLKITVVPVQRADNGTEYIFICDDISNERSLEEQRTEFISVASHELRTPLAIVEASLASVTAAQGIDNETKLLVNQAHRNTLHLINIVKDLTILSEAQNDNLPFQPARINATAMLNDCAKDFEAEADRRGITLRTGVEVGTPRILSTEHHIREILHNFLTNAFKYSQKGTITIKAAPASNGGILFSVQDQGVGISAEDQELLFRKFFRAEDFRTRETSGTGLGLYLCMELAERMDGKIWCESELDKGSTFYLEVPELSHLRRDVIKAEVGKLVHGS